MRFKIFFKKHLTFFIFLIVSTVGILFIERNETHVWDMTTWDAADYIYIAKHFWGLPQVGISFGPDFNSAWQWFLSTFPFRQIGTGSYYLFLSTIFGSHVNTWGPYATNILVATSYAWLSYIWSIKTNKYLGWICLIILLITTNVFSSGNFMWTEPLLRICFVIGFGLLMLKRKSESFTSNKYLVSFFILSLVLIQIKVQWIIFGLLIMGYFGAILIYKRDWKKFITVCCLAVLLPLSIFVTNVIGWNYWGIVGGNSLHSMYMPHYGSTRFLQTICQREEVIAFSPRFCTEHRYRFKTWATFMRYQYSQQDMYQLVQTMDYLSKDMIDNSPKGYVKTVANNLPRFTNFPLMHPWMPIKLIIGLTDILAFLVCVFGFYFSRTRLISLFCLGLWIVPLIGAHFAMWDDRYLTPMAGLPILGAILIVYKMRYRKI